MLEEFKFFWQTLAVSSQFARLPFCLELADASRPFPCFDFTSGANRNLLAKRHTGASAPHPALKSLLFFVDRRRGVCFSPGRHPVIKKKSLPRIFSTSKVWARVERQIVINLNGTFERGIVALGSASIETFARQESASIS